MPVFEIRPASLPNGRFAAAWFDDDDVLWDDDRLHKPQRLLAAWSAPWLRLHPPARGATPLLFNPNAYAVSAAMRAQLAHCSGVEFLPIEIAGCGAFFVLHVIASCAAPEGCSLRRAPRPSGNIVELFSFPAGYSPGADFFRIAQPSHSAAGVAGYCFSSIYVSINGAGNVEKVCGGYLSVKKVG